MHSKNGTEIYSVSNSQEAMSVSGFRPSDMPNAFDGLAAAVLDNRGVVLRWTGTAEDLTGFTAEEVCGRPVQDLVADLPGEMGRGTEMPASGQARLRHRSGDTIDVTFRTAEVEGAAEFLVLAAPAHHVANHEQGAALLHALSSQDRIRFALHDADLAIVQTNAMPGAFDGCGVRPGTRLCDLLCVDDAENLEAVLHQVLNTGAPVIRSIQLVRWRRDPARQQALSLSAFRLEDVRGHPRGVAAVYIDATDQLHARRHLDLARKVAEHVGTSLDVVRTAQQLADVLVPSFGDLAEVALAESVFDGDEPPQRLGGGDLHLRNAAMAPAGPVRPAGAKVGDRVPPIREHSHLRSFQLGQTVVFSRDEYRAAFGDPQVVELLSPEDFHSVIFAPLYARGLLLGLIAVWRVGESDQFTKDEADLMTLIASRGALAIDNARRHTREYRATIALQQLLLPPATTNTPAAETVGLYLPAGGGPDIGGEWFDAIPLPSLRLALVAGDVNGHGIPATATMGRLRSAIQALADLELDPDELLTRIADLVQRLAVESPPAEGDTIDPTCLYAVYDPLARRCTLASAGHPPPLLVRPDGTTQVVGICAGPPLAVGGMPYEMTTIDLEPGSVLALYTDGLIKGGSHDADHGLRHLRDALAASYSPDLRLDDTGRAVLAGVGDQPSRDDMALLLARTRAIPAEDTAKIELPADPAAASAAREWTARQLATWGLNDLLFATELIVSELVTNSVRYGRPPVTLRLIRHNVLVCEVTDSSATQPRLRRARATDEGGRGLFIVAQLTTRWGCRYSQDRKTIWCEQEIPTANGATANGRSA